MMLDAYQPLGVTRLAVDSVFMLPHLGVLSTVHPEAAAEVFLKDCLVDLGTVVAPAGNMRKGVPAFEVIFGKDDKLTVNGGDLRVLSLDTGEQMKVRIRPLTSTLDFGAGPGKEFQAVLYGGPAGIILDARGRPLSHPTDDLERISAVSSWFKSFGLSW